MRLDRRDRLALGWGTGVVLAAVLLLRVFPWLIGSSRGALESLRARRELLAHSQAELALTPLLEDSAAAVRRAVVALAPRILGGGTEAEALAVVSGELNHLATSHRSRMLRLDAHPDSGRAGELRRLTVDVAFEGDVRGLTSLLADLANAPLVLWPSHLLISTTDVATADRTAEVLHLELTLTGWYLVARTPA